MVIVMMMDSSWRFGEDRDNDDGDDDDDDDGQFLWRFGDDHGEDDDDHGWFFWRFGAHWCEDCVEILRPILRSSLRQEMVPYRQGNFETRDGTLQTRQL